MKVRLVQVVAWQIGAVTLGEGCTKGLHRAEIAVAKYHSRDVAELAFESQLSDAVKADPRLRICNDCKQEFEPHVGPSRCLVPVYNTPSGKPEPFDCYYGEWYKCVERGHCIYGWTNCDGRHLFVVLPEGTHWDVDSRATNCTMPNDNTHRCWVLHGEAPNVHVDKNGPTCGAGGGSIMVPGFHGFLHHGDLHAC